MRESFDEEMQMVVGLIEALSVTPLELLKLFGNRSTYPIDHLESGHTRTVLLPRHPQLDHHPLVPFVIDRKMAMEENAAVFFKLRTRDGLAARTVGVEGCGPQDDVLAVERAVALANRHGRLTRVEPHGGEAICFGVEARDSSAGALCSVRIEEGEI